jgi:polyisoprenoid-binding protein YceI
MFPRLFALLLICFSFRAVSAENPVFSAGAVEIEINPARSAVRFTLGALLHTVHGSFKVKGGTVRFDPASGLASGQIAVDVKTGETGDDARDRQMHESVLESNSIPDAVFSPDHLQGPLAMKGNSQLEIHGTLRLHGGEHEMTIPVNVIMQDHLITATAKFVIPYVAWGLKDPSNLILRVDQTVKVEAAITGQAVSLK